MSYQQPPNDRPNAPPGPPPGWYPDPNGLPILRWWDGGQWGPHTQPLPGMRQQLQPQFPDAEPAGSERYSAFGQEDADRNWQQTGPQGGTASRTGGASGQYPAAFPAAPPQDPYQPYGQPQQPHVPVPQPQAHRTPRRRRNKARGVLIGLGTLIGIIAIIVATTAHSSPSTGNVAATSTTSAAAPAASSAAASSPPDCRSQVISWRDNGGLTQLDAVTTDTGNVGSAATALGTDLSTGADASQDEASLQTAAASLQSDSQTAQANLPPSCVPHLRADYGGALNDASKAALDCQDAVSELGSGNYSVAIDDVNAANAAMSGSSNKFQAAASDIKAFSNG
jgi:Protein of unknown function (DUF2510)